MGDDNPEERLKWAVQNGECEEAQSLLTKNPSLVNSEVSGRPYLCVAADYGHLDIIKLLIEKGADINVVDKHGITPLLSAIFENHKGAVQLLLEKGACRDGKAPDGSSYVDAADSQEIKQLLK